MTAGVARPQLVQPAMPPLRGCSTVTFVGSHPSPSLQLQNQLCHGVVQHSRQADRQTTQL